jgi:asparagine synthase (glutamine-hydrolysing)
LGVIFISIHIHLGNSNLWFKSNGLYINGNAFFNEGFVDARAIAQIFSNIKTFEDFVILIEQFNGFFAVIYKRSNEVFLGVDRVRSIPLFYSILNGEIYASDDPYWIVEQIKDHSIDNISALEFLLTGYVTGKDTLNSNIKQLQSGEAIRIDNANKKKQITAMRYYRYIPKSYSKKTFYELSGDLDRTMLKIFDRLIAYAKGRMIVVPLSGGYDSRLIVLMLKRMRYKNVTAFSYGLPGNKESVISEKIAKILDIQWEFVPYSYEAWHKWYSSEERKAYYKQGFGLSSQPHGQDWPAVLHLKNNSLIPEDSIFVPGHSADLLAGSRSIAVPMAYRENADVDSTIIQILNYHYSLWNWYSKREDLKTILVDRISLALGDSKQFQDSASAFESWDVQERQAKFIINSVRAYEFAGYNWWLPFWDYEFMDFWSRVPIDAKINERFYINYVNELFEKITGCYAHNFVDLHNSKLQNEIVTILRKTPFLRIVRNIYDYRNKLTAYGKDPLAINGIISKEEFDKLFTGKENINSFEVYYILNSMVSCSNELKGLIDTIVVPSR